MSTTTASAGIKQNVTVNYTLVDSLSVAYSGSPSISLSTQLSSSDITKCFTNEATISTGTTIDLASVTNAFGAALVFAHLKGLFIQNNSSNQTLTIGGSTHPVLGSDQYTLGAGQVIFITTPFVVTSGSSNNLLLTPSGSLNYTLIAIGT